MALTPAQFSEYVKAHGLYVDPRTGRLPDGSWSWSSGPLTKPEVAHMEALKRQGYWFISSTERRDLAGLEDRLRNHGTRDDYAANDPRTIQAALDAAL